MLQIALITASGSGCRSDTEGKSTFVCVLFRRQDDLLVETGSVSRRRGGDTPPARSSLPTGTRCFHCLAADQSGGEGDGDDRGAGRTGALQTQAPRLLGLQDPFFFFCERSPNLIRSQRAYLFSWLKSSGTRFPQERKRTLFTEGQGQNFKASCLEDALSAELRYTLAFGRSQPRSGGRTGQSQRACKWMGMCSR